MLDAVWRLFGRDRVKLSVPILDGAFKPNNLLEEADVALAREGLEDMATGPGGALFLACGNELLRLKSNGEAETVKAYEGAITALAVLKDGRVAAALADRIVVDGRAPLVEAVGRKFRAVTALSVAADGRLLVCDASADRDGDEWRCDLLNRGATGRLVAIDVAAGQAQVLQSGLGWAYGALQRPSGDILVSESWRHRLRVAGRKDDGAAELPGYPARLSAAADGGFWLALFSGRMQIVEFVLSEAEFRREMMATIDPKYWISPAYSSGEDFLEPLQGGGVKHMGILKPWAPPRSYGLVVKFDARGDPVMSAHSRVGGRHHGIVCVLERGDQLFALSKGAGRLLRLDLRAVRVANGIEGRRP